MASLTASEERLRNNKAVRAMLPPDRCSACSRCVKLSTVNGGSSSGGSTASAMASERYGVVAVVSDEGQSCW